MTTPVLSLARNIATAAFVACAACGASLSASAPTTTRAASTPGWLEVRAASAGVSFLAPTTDPKAVHEFSSFREYRSFIDSRPSDDEQGLVTKYARFIALRDGDTTYSVWVAVVDDDKLAMMIQVFSRGARKAEQHSEIKVSGYAGIEALSRGTDGVDAARSWTAADRFYVALVHTKNESSFSEEKARTFLSSIAMLDRP